MTNENMRFVAGDVVSITLPDQRSIKAYALCTDTGTFKKFSFLGIVASQSRQHSYDVVTKCDTAGLPICIDGSKLLRLNRDELSQVSVVTNAQSALPKALKRVALFSYDLECFTHWHQRQTQGHSKVSYQRAKLEFLSAKRLSEVDIGFSTSQFLKHTRTHAKLFDHDR